MIPRLVNSTIITVTAIALSALVGSLGGYSLGRSRSALARVLFVLIGIALYLPYQVVIFPLSIMIAQAGLSRSHAGLIASYLILNVPVACVLIGTFFPVNTARFGGSCRSGWCLQGTDLFPDNRALTLPAYTSVAIIIFTQVWNKFFLALTLSSRQTQTLQVVMAEAKGTTLVLDNLQMAAALIATALPMLLFLLLGRYFVRGVLAGALKG